MSRSEKLALGALLAAALVLRMAVATASPSILWPDEVYQSLEQAHRLAFGPGLVPWEFRDGARSWLLPGILAGVMRAFAPFGAGSSGYLGGVRAVLALLSLTAPLATYVWTRRTRGASVALAAATIPALWFELVYFAPKALSEAVAAHALIAGALLVEAPIAGGALLGLAVVLRVHLAPATLVLGALAPGGLRGRARLLAAGLAVVLAGGLLDWATWGSPFHSVALNLRANVAEGRSATYGTAGAEAYFEVFGRVWGLAALLLVPLALVGAARLPAVAAAAVTVLATHVLFAHKEYRFVYPALALVLVLVGRGAAEVAAWAGGRRAAFAAFALAALVAALSGLRATRYTWSAQSLVGGSGEGETALWRHLRGPLRAYEALSKDDRVCGVGLENRRWNRTGGYAYLHRDVPVFEITSDPAWARWSQSFNAFLVRADGPPTVGAFARESCFDDVCLYFRPGACAPAPDYRGPLRGRE